jgi:histidinol phosphatase-like enzyme (inositol monophosphatase family)
MSLADEVEERLSVALPLIEEAGRLALRHFRQPLAVENKLGPGVFDPVTEADRGVEALIRAGLSRTWPDSAIQGEEDGLTPGDSEWSWIIDPIDGTRAFISGVPAWGILLGLLKAGRPVGGVMRQPYLDETFLGGPSGAWLLRAGARLALRASAKVDLADAILYSTHPRLFADPAEQVGFERVSAAVRMTRFGGDCYSYCLVAAGYVDLVIESSLQPYDIVPLIPIVQAAGGVVTGLDGALPLHGGTVIAAASPALHAAALALMRAS